jgi:hypothetical protein
MKRGEKDPARRKIAKVPHGVVSPSSHNPLFTSMFFCTGTSGGPQSELGSTLYTAMKIPTKLTINTGVRDF